MKYLAGNHIERAIDLAEEYCHRPFGQARDELEAVNELIEAALETIHDARVLGMEIKRLSAALDRLLRNGRDLLKPECTNP